MNFPSGFVSCFLFDNIHFQSVAK